MQSEIHYIISLVALAVEEGNAKIIQVVAYACKVALQQCLPHAFGSIVVADVLYNKQGAVVCLL